MTSHEELRHLQLKSRLQLHMYTSGRNPN